VHRRRLCQNITDFAIRFDFRAGPSTRTGGDTLRRSLFLVIVIGLFCLSNLTRWGFRSRFARPRFAAEGAAHLRYTALVSRGEPIPALDRDAQWPEGLRVFRETSIGMEYLYGLLYRLVPGESPDLVRFLRFCVPFIFSLAIFPLAFLAAALWGRRSAGILAALLFAVSLPLVARSSGFDLIRENLTFPLIVFHLYYLLSVWYGGAKRDAVVSAVFLSLALATWQGTQFYLVPLFGFFVARAVLGTVTAAERRAVRPLVAGVVATGALVPFLRAGGFLLSVPLALAAAWCAVDCAAIRARRGRRPGGSGAVAPRGASGREARYAGMRGESGPPDGHARGAVRVAAAIVGCACILVPGIIFREHFASYSHFFKLIVYKLRYVYKPDDPRLLPFDARSFWVGPFHSPDPRHLFVFAFPLVCLLPNPAARLVRRAREGNFAAIFIVVFTLVFFVLFLLMQRLLPLFAVFAVLAAAGATLDLFTARGGRSVPGYPFIAVFCVLGIFILQDFAWEGPADIWRRAARTLRIPSRRSFVIYPSVGDPEGDMLDWIGENTEPDAVVMSLHYLSPQVLTYTGRSTNLNDFFESPRLRRKAQRLLALLYGGEERLLVFCREQESDYLLVSAALGCDPTRDSPLYQAGLADMPPDCAAYRLMFEPMRLSHFNLVYENEMYRIFRVGESPARRWWPRSPLFYERELLWRFEGDIAAFYHGVMRIYALTARGRSLMRAGRVREAERPLGEALRLYYFYPAWRLLADRYRRGGRSEELEALAEFGYRHDPHRADVCLLLARARLDRGGSEGVGDLLERAERLSPSDRQRREIEDLRRTLGGLTGGR
jgi:hypothetical protein